MGWTLIESQADWRGADMARREDWVHRLTAEEIADIERAFRAARGIPLADLRKVDFPLDRFGMIAERALELLENGPGMFLIRGFPTERYARSLQQQERGGEAPYYEQPIFTSHQGHFACRYIRTHIRSAQRFPEVPRLTPEQLQAMDLVDRLAASPEFHFSMTFEPGDVQLLSNHVTLHARTLYEDYGEPERMRHLLRMWLSVPNSRPLSPLLGKIYPDQRPGAVRGGFPSRTGRLVFETTEA